MILTDREIANAIRCGQIIIDPHPDPTAFSSTSLDLTLAPKGRRWNTSPGVLIKPGDAKYKYTQMMRYQEQVNIDNYQLEPNQLLLAWTNEQVELPIASKIAARVEGKSSLARIGIGVHVTAPTIHSGFKGAIQLEMLNFASHTIILTSGLKVCQIIFERTLGTPEAGYRGMFFGQTAS